MSIALPAARVQGACVRMSCKCLCSPTPRPALRRIRLGRSGRTGCAPRRMAPGCIR